jgi:hypothetical protein
MSSSLFKNHNIVRARFLCCERIQRQSAATMRLNFPLYAFAKGVSRTPHSWGIAELWSQRNKGMLGVMLWVMAPAKAGEEGVVGDDYVGGAGEDG